jgi:hypothetical protein
MHDTIYVQNKSLHQTLRNTTPEEASTGVKPETEHFRIFGCPMYFYVPKEKNSKLDPLEREDIMNFQRPRESQIEIDSEIIPSPPSAVHRDTNIIPADPVSPADMFIDIAVEHKMPT